MDAGKEQFEFDVTNYTYTLSKKFFSSKKNMIEKIIDKVGEKYPEIYEGKENYELFYDAIQAALRWTINEAGLSVSKKHYDRDYFI